MYIVFENPGTFDFRLLTTFGANVKPNSTDPIGYFGTGLKYAVAIVLRLGGKSWMHVDGVEYELYIKQDEIRGKMFNMIAMRAMNVHASNEVLLPFTTELGKNWKSWMAYRELWSNCSDESGIRTASETRPRPELGKVRFIVTGAEMYEHFLGHYRYFLNTGMELVGKDAFVEVYNNPTRLIYYRGVLVGEHQRQAMFTYNFSDGVILTEDRVLAYSYYKDYYMRDFWQGELRKHTDDVLMATGDYAESRIEFTTDMKEPVFQRVIELHNTHKSRLNKTAIKVLHTRRPEMRRLTAKPLTIVETRMLEKAIAIAKHHGFPVDDSKFEIIVTDALGEHLLGEYDDNKIYISSRCMSMGTKMVVGTLIEEWIHGEKLLGDMTREFQNYIIDRMCGFMEQIDGEPM